MKKTSHAFVNQVFVCVLVSIGFGGSIGLGTVWLRHQISITANENRILAGRLAEIERRIAETKTLVESEQSPDALRRLNANLHLGLVPVSDGQPTTGTSLASPTPTAAAKPTRTPEYEPGPVPTSWKPSAPSAAVSRLFARRPRMTSSVKVSIPQSEW